MGVCLLSGSNFAFSCQGSKKVENTSICFLNWRGEETLVVNNEDNIVFYVQHTSLLGKIFILRKQISAG